MVDPGRQVHSRITIGDEAICGAGYQVIPMDIQPSLVDLPDQLRFVPRIMSNGQQFTDSDEEILVAYEHHVALQGTPAITAPMEVSHRNDCVQELTTHGNQQLTESDEELLQAYDIYTAPQRNPANIVSLEDFDMNEYAPEGSNQERNYARSPSVEEWARNTIIAAAIPELSELLVSDAQSLAKIVMYVNDIAPFSMIMEKRLANTWPYLASEWVTPVSLLQQLRLRVAVYHPHTWDFRQRQAFAISDAADWDSYFRKVDQHSSLARHYGAANNANEPPAPVLLFSQSASYGTIPAALPLASAWAADDREFFW